MINGAVGKIADRVLIAGIVVCDTQHAIEVTRDDAIALLVVVLVTTQVTRQHTQTNTRRDAQRPRRRLFVVQ